MSEYYYEPIIKQLIEPNGKWFIVYDEEEEDEIEVIYFAVCDLIVHKRPESAVENCYGIILPVTISVDSDEILEVIMAKFYNNNSVEYKLVKRYE